MNLTRVILVAGIVTALAAGLTLQGFARSDNPNLEPDAQLAEAMEAWVLAHHQREGVHVAVFGETRLVMVALGERPTGGYGVSVERVTRGDHGQLILEVKATEPGPDDMVTEALTHPYVLVTVADHADESPVRVIDVDTGEVWGPSSGQ